MLFLNPAQVNYPLNNKVNFRTKIEERIVLWSRLEGILVHSTNPDREEILELEDATVHIFRQRCSCLVLSHCFFPFLPLLTVVLDVLCL